MPPKAEQPAHERLLWLAEAATVQHLSAISGLADATVASRSNTATGTKCDEAEEVRIELPNHQQAGSSE